MKKETLEQIETINVNVGIAFGVAMILLVLALATLKQLSLI